MSLINHKQSQVIVKTLAEKQAYWAEQLPLFKEAYWLPEHFQLLEFDMEAGNFVIREDIDQDFKDDADDLFHRINTGWSMWKRAVNHMNKKLEGCVVVPVEMPDSFNDATTDYFNDISEGENYDAFVKLVDIDNKSIWAMAVEAARGGNE